MKKMLAIVLSVLMCATLLTACGDGTATDSEDAVQDNAADTAGASAETAEADTTAEGDTAIPNEAETDNTDEESTLVVGTNAEFPPFEFMGDDGEPDGFDVALIKAIGEKIGRDVVIENMEFDTLVLSIGSKIDLAIAAMTITEERQNSVDFSNPYYEAVQYVIVPAGSEIASAADLEGKTIGVQLGTTGDFIVEEIEGAEAVQFKKGLDAVNDLLNGRVDCVIIDKNPALVFESRYADQITAIDGGQFGFETENYAIALPKGDTELADQINQALKELIEDGTYDELVNSYIE